ncbi:MFS transporter [Pseudonocardia sp. GCM10023141]|uniref:MFS transporter n=1 Tax=Pseudonocardia sp. GCM10023141 TaxID=3252653 RepID=UPI0036213EEB
MTPHDDARPARSRWAAVGMLAVGTFAIGTDGFVVAGVLGGIAGDLSVPAAAAGQIVTVFALAYALGSPLLSTLIGGRRQLPVLVGALVLFAVFNVLAALAPALGLLVAARVLCALAAAAYTPAAGAAAAAMVPPAYRGRALAVVLGGMSVATVVGAPVGIAVAGMGSWRWTFVLVAALSVLAATGLLLMRPPVGAAVRRPLAQRLLPLRHRAVPAALGVTLLGMAAGYGIYTYLDPIFAPEPGVGRGALGLLVAVHGLGGLIGTWAGGTLADRWGPYRTVLVALTLVTVVFAVSPLIGSTLPGAVAFLFLWGVTGWAFVPAQQHRLVGIDPEHAPLLISLNSSAVYIGIAAGGLGGGLIVAAAGADRLWIWAVGCCVAAVALQALTGRLSARSGGPRSPHAAPAASAAREG